MTNELFTNWSELWLPPKRLQLSEWAENYFILSSSYSARSGPIKLFPFQREILDCVTDPTVQELVLMSSTQLVKTLCLQIAIAYTMVCDPSTILLVQPTQEDAKTFSKERLARMLTDIPILKGVVENNSKTGQDTILQKEFVGGSLSIVGSQAPGNLARRSVRLLLLDEVSKYPVSAGNEGDVIALAKERCVTFGSRKKIIMCCSPTVENDRIHQAYQETDQRQAWVPCPHCNTFQILEWEHVEFSETGTTAERAETAIYLCPHCNAQWNDLERWNACQNLEWRAQKPFAGKAGFQISHLYSPWKTLGSMVADYLAAKHSRNRERLRVFYNTTLAQPWREIGQAPQEELLYSQREKYNAELPNRVLFLTAGLDVQPDRVEVEVVGWCRNGESYSIDYQVIEALDSYGKRLSVQSPEVWNKVDQLLKRKWQHESGAEMQLWLMACDTGSLPQPIYNFCLTHPQPSFSTSGNIHVHSYASVIPIKGSADNHKVISSVSSEDASRKRKGGIKIVGVGTNVVKTRLFDALRFLKPDKDTPVPGACHFPDSYGIEYFKSLCSEERIVTDSGKVSFQNKGSQRNEVLDCRVYAIAAATICGLEKFKEQQWLELESRILNIPSQTPTIPKTATAPQTYQPQRPNWIERKSNWLR